MVDKSQVKEGEERKLFRGPARFYYIICFPLVVVKQVQTGWAVGERAPPCRAVGGSDGSWIKGFVEAFSGLA